MDRETLQLPGVVDAAVRSLPSHVLALLALAVILYLVVQFLRPGRASRRRRTRDRSWQQPTGIDVSDPSVQMNAIAKVDFETVPVLNREEFRVYGVLEKALAERRDGSRLMVQTSLGEIIRPRHAPGSKAERDLAYRSINSKRLDFAVFDREGRLALAVEYQGSGHYHQTSFMRDAVKKEALRKAGVPLLEVRADFQPAELSEQVRRALPREEAPLARQE